MEPVRAMIEVDLHALARGEAPAIDAFYRSQARRVLDWVRRLGGPWLDAEDVAQDVFTVAIRKLRDLEHLTLIGSGGVRNGVDMAKAIACGADIVGLAYPFLVAADESKEEVVAAVHRIVEELKICMFCVGAGSIEELQHTDISRPTWK